jgi:hypothetical protein
VSNRSYLTTSELNRIYRVARIQLFVGGLFNSEHQAVTVGLGYRHPLYSSSK